jgi:transcription antitermination factor NusG
MAYLSSKTWFAVQVLAQHEAKVASILAYKGYEHFSPTYRPGATTFGKANTSARPLFPGYVFCRLLHEVTGLVCSTPGVIRFVGFRGRPAPIGDDEIEAVRRVVESDLTVWPASMSYYIGQKVQVRNGVLSGLTGSLVQMKNRNRFLIFIEIMMKGIAVDIDARDIVPLQST